MAKTEDLFQLDGVVALAQLDDMGRIVDWKAKGVVDPEIVKEHTSKMLMEITSTFRDFAREAPRNWSPTRALIYSGGDMTLIAAGTVAVTVETKKVNFEKLFKAFGILGYSK